MTELNQMLSMFERAGVEYTQYKETFYDSSLAAINGKYPGRQAVMVQIGDQMESWNFWFETTGELIA